MNRSYCTTTNNYRTEVSVVQPTAAVQISVVLCDNGATTP